MEAKKNPSRDVHRMYPLKLLAGFCVSIAIVIGLFELRFKTIVQPYRPPAWEEAVALLDPNIVAEINHPVETKPARTRLIPVPSVIEVSEESSPVDPVLFEDPEETVAVAPMPELITVPEGDEPIILAEEAPVPTGGFEGFYKFIGKEVRYPRAAVSAEIEGKVFVEFIVDREGNPTALKVLKGIGYGCDEEALRVLARTQWKAGRQRGKAVRVRMVLPIQFSLKR